MAQLLAPVFGSGKDGVLTISSSVTDSPIDSSCSGSQGTNTLSATNAGFQAGQLILIHQSRGTGAGQWELNRIASYTTGTITTLLPLAYTYTDSEASQAQVLVVKEYSQVNVNSGATWTAKAWNGDVGGILAFACNGKVTVAGTITATSKGFRAAPAAQQTWAYQGEGTANVWASSRYANGNGGGGGYHMEPPVGTTGGGGGGGHANAGLNGRNIDNRDTWGYGGNAAGLSDLSIMVFGGAAGAALKPLLVAVRWQEIALLLM